MDPEEIEVEVTDPVEGEVAAAEAEPIESPNPIADFLDAVAAQNFTQAERQFNDMIGDRLQDTLDQAKERLASAIYDDESGEEVDDVTDQEVEDELDAFEDEKDADDENVAPV